MKSPKAYKYVCKLKHRNVLKPLKHNMSHFVDEKLNDSLIQEEDKIICIKNHRNVLHRVKAKLSIQNGLRFNPKRAVSRALRCLSPSAPPRKCFSNDLTNYRIRKHR